MIFFIPRKYILYLFQREYVVLKQISAMDRPEIQKIVVYLEPDGSDIHLTAAATRLASAFRKDLMLLSLIPDSIGLKEAESKLQHHADKIMFAKPGLSVTAKAMPHPGRKLSIILADELETIIFVAGSRRFKELSATLRSSPIPFLFVNEDQPCTSDFKKTVIPVDMRSQNKDSLLWSVFFGRNNRSEVIAIGANDRSSESRKQIANHLNSLKKLLIKSAVPHKIYRGSRGSFSIQQEALETAGKLGADLMILLGSSYITWLDRLIGLPEEKIIRRAGMLPVLIVNPRRETYLVCD